MRHAVERLQAAALPEPASAVCRPTGLSEQVLAALHGAREHVGGQAVAIKPQQAEDGAGAAADHVELLVRRNQIVAEQLRRRVRVCEQIVVVQAFRHRGERIDDRAETRCAAHAQCDAPCAPRCRPLSILRRCATAASASSPRRLASRDRRMRGEKQRDAAHAVVEIGAETARAGQASESPSQSRPIQAAAGPRADGVARQLRRRSCRLPPEESPCRARLPVPVRRTRRLLARSGSASERETVAVFCRMTSTCQAISRSSKSPTRARARARPGVASVDIDTPFASHISWPSLGDTKCGTFSASSAARSARCNGQSGSARSSQSASLREEVRLRRPGHAVVHAAMVSQPLQQHVIEPGGPNDPAHRPRRQSRRTARPGLAPALAQQEPGVVLEARDEVVDVVAELGVAAVDMRQVRDGVRRSSLVFVGRMVSELMLLHVSFIRDVQSDVIPPIANTLLSGDATIGGQQADHQDRVGDNFRRGLRTPAPRSRAVCCSDAGACRIISRSIGTGCSPAAIMFSWCMSLPAKQWNSASQAPARRKKRSQSSVVGAAGVLDELGPAVAVARDRAHRFQFERSAAAVQALDQRVPGNVEAHVLRLVDDARAVLEAARSAPSGRHCAGRRGRPRSRQRGRRASAWRMSRRIAARSASRRRTKSRRRVRSTAG